jgi:hypothetical protein
MSKTASRESFAALALGAMGVVYGDIGTSPLYTMKEVFSPATGIALDATHLIGAVSVIFWGLMLVVTLKYVLLILRADNRGEGGIMALTALAAEAAGSTRRRRTAPAAGRCARRGPVLRRQRDHAGHLGAQRDGGAGGCHPGAEGLRDSDLGGRAHRPVRGAAPRHRGGRQAVRPGDRAVVRGAGAFRVSGDRPPAGHPGGAQPAQRPGLPARSGLAGVCRRGRHRAGLHRGRGAVCRHGALRQEADPAGLDRPGAAGPGHQLHGPGRAADA